MRTPSGAETDISPLSGLIDTKEFWILIQSRQACYAMANLPFEYDFLAFRTTQPLLDLIRVPGSAGILPAVIKSIRAPARSLH
jgi:hypothetical protein